MCGKHVVGEGGVASTLKCSTRTGRGGALLGLGFITDEEVTIFEFQGGVAWRFVGVASTSIFFVACYCLSFYLSLYRACARFFASSKF